MIDLRESLETAVRGRYTLLEELGHGAMGVVFLAHAASDGHRVAIKVLQPDRTISLPRERFLREMRICSALHHENIAAILECRDSGDVLYYAMEYVDGVSLRELIENEHRLPIARALDIARQVGSALAYAHAEGVIHRDIKPENILLTGSKALLSDFGVARAIRESTDEALTEPGTTLGTPYYMSPEQARGSRRLDGRSDIYSLACVLYEMLTGLPPFMGDDDRMILVRRIMDPPPKIRSVRPEVPRRVDRALRKALATNRDNRYRSVAQFVDALPRLDVS